MHVAIDDGYQFGTSVDQITQRFLSHITGTNKHDAFIIKPLEELGGYLADRNARHADAAAMDRAFRFALVWLHRLHSKNTIGQHASQLAGAGDFVGLLDLGQYLSFADDHAVQAGRDRKQMLNRLIAAEFDQLGCNVAGYQAMVMGQKLTDGISGR